MELPFKERIAAGAATVGTDACAARYGWHEIKEAGFGAVEMRRHERPLAVLEHPAVGGIGGVGYDGGVPIVADAEPVPELVHIEAAVRVHQRRQRGRRSLRVAQL